MSVIGAPEVSVVIPCRDVVAVVEDQLRALANQTFTGTMEVLLADNGSRDGLRTRVPHWAEHYGLALRWVDAGGTAGVSHARNTGLRAALADVVVVCDADDVVCAEWVSAMAEGLAVHDVVGGPLELARLNDEVRRTWRGGPSQKQLPQKLGFLPYAVGANVGVRREAALDAGGWDESYLAGGDDVDFAWRLQLRGHHLGFAPGAVVHYRFREDLRGTARQLHSYARCEAKLLRQYAIVGAERYRPSRTRRDVGWLWRRVPDLFAGPAFRGRWLCRASTVIGRVQGSARARTWVG